jgi:raffinose/stachyose/melibiose transport system substrate-binding protein
MTHTINRRTALTALGAAGAALATGIRPAAAQSTELSFWTWRQEDRTQYAELFGMFTRDNPGIRFAFQGFEPQNYGTALSTALAAGRGPDVIHIRAYGGLEQFSKAGYLEPLSPQTVPELANYTPSALASVTDRSDRKPYAVPFASQTLGIFYNRDVLSRNGVQPPETWDQLIAACKALKDKGVIPLANGMATAFMAEIFTAALTLPLHGKAFNDDLVAGKATFEDPRYVGALAKLLELREYMPPGFTGIDYPTMQQLFLSGRAAMFVGGSFEIANFRRQNANLPMEFMAPPAPTAGAPRLVPVFYDGGYAVNAKSDKKEAALKLIRFFSTPAFGNKFTELLGNISPIAGVRIADPMLARVAELNKTSGDHITLVHFRYQSPTGSELLTAGVQKLMGGSATPAQVAKEVTDGIATYHAPFRRG